MLSIATLDDIDDVMDLAMKFAKESPYRHYIELDTISNLVHSILVGNADTQIIFIYREEDKAVGMLAGVTNTFIYGSTKMATELAWWVDEDKRNTHIGTELLNAFEYWAKSLDCKVLTMMSLDDKVSSFYEKHGFKLYERAYFKEI